METFLGKKGLNKTWQNKFEETAKCHKCGGEARIMFVAFEGDAKEFVCSMHDNKGEGGYWPHDAIACAVYLCRDCFEPVAIINQA